MDEFILELDRRQLHLGLDGVLALDYLELDERNRKSSGLHLERAVLRLDGWIDDFFWRAAPDLVARDTPGVEELWLAWQPASLERFLRLEIGLLEVPLSLEQGIPLEELPFTDHAFPAQLDSRTDWTLRAEGELFGGTLTWDLAFSAGEGFNPHGDRVSGPRATGRLIAFPLRSLSGGSDSFVDRLLEGLFAGVSLSHAWQPAGKFTVANSLGNELFTVRRLEADRTTFLYFGYGYQFGPVRFLHEVVRGGYDNLETPAGERDLDDQITAWAMSLSWRITGESYEYSPLDQLGGRRHLVRREEGPGFPDRPLWARDGDARSRGPGVIEIAARYANGDIDREFFNLGFTDYTTSSQEFRTVAVALNWYPVTGLRASIQLVRTLADQFPATFDSHGRDTSVLLRLQTHF